MIIFSIPVTTNTIAINITNDNIVKPGNTIAIIESKIVNTPSPIWAPLIHCGDLFIVVNITILLE